ncbi:hypothetical protein FRC12_020530 [Ceratobasidium sp. 428]|nr:hypothetical protein FRC12_020530 [Ceratobasidium sp. 428]
MNASPGIGRQSAIDDDGVDSWPQSDSTTHYSQQYGNEALLGRSAVSLAPSDDLSFTTAPSIPQTFYSDYYEESISLLSIALSADDPLPENKVDSGNERPLASQSQLSLATVVAQMDLVQPVANILTNTLHLVRQSRVGRERWELLLGRCVMVARIAGARVVHGEGEKYPGLQHVSRILYETIVDIGQCVYYWNQMHELLALVQIQGIDKEIRGHFSSLDWCLSLFSHVIDNVKMQCIGEFDMVQRHELFQLERIRALMDRMDINPNINAQTQNTLAGPDSLSLQAPRYSRLPSPISTTASTPHYEASEIPDDSVLHSRSASSLAQSVDELMAEIAILDLQHEFTLTETPAELMPIPLPVVSRHKEQWRLLRGRCVDILCITDVQMTNYDREQRPIFMEAYMTLRDTVAHIAERCDRWNQLSELVASVQFRKMREEIKGHLSSLDSCVSRFRSITHFALTRWIGEFEATQKEQMRTLTDRMYLKLEAATDSLNTRVKATQETFKLLSRTMDENIAILQSQATTPIVTPAGAQPIVHAVRTVINIQFLAQLLLGQQCILNDSVPINTGVACDTYSASLLTNEKVAKKVLRITVSEREHVELYVHRFLQNTELWATFRSDYAIQLYGVGADALENNQRFELYTVSPLMKNLDAVAYLKQHKEDLGVQEEIMRIITDAAEGLQYLHTRDPPVVHCGMRGDNILVTDTGGGILSGFGSIRASVI